MEGDVNKKVQQTKISKIINRQRSTASYSKANKQESYQNELIWNYIKDLFN